MNLPAEVDATPVPDATSAEPLLECRDVVRRYTIISSTGRGRRRRKVVTALDGVSVAVRPGRSLAVIGESGSGKSTLLRLLLRLERPSVGSVQFRRKDLGELDGPGVRVFRREVQAVFQDPYSSLNPGCGSGRPSLGPCWPHRQA
jgi:ABC-type glutathione transport system ATPase component